jgi:hypothetical protein
LNEKWFNYAIVLTVIMVFVNAFITVGAGQPNADGSLNLYLLNSTNNTLSYNSLKNSSDFDFNSAYYDSSSSPTNEQGLTPVTRPSDSVPVGLNAFDAAVTMAVGVELVMLTLAAIFWPVAALFYAVAGVAFFIKAIVVAYLGSILIRSILGRIV